MYVETDLNDRSSTQEFERQTLPHLDAAYSFARWLTRDSQAAQDLVQAAYLRAFRFFEGYEGGNMRAWLLMIVRNVHYSELRERRYDDQNVDFDDDLHSADIDLPGGVHRIGTDPMELLTSAESSRVVNRALEALPKVFREIVVLKDIDALSYKEIASIVDIPIGTVMSRLARGRKLLLSSLRDQQSAK